MFGTRQVSAPARGRSILALSVLALLALGFPVLAQADSSGIQYSDAPPTVTGGQVPNGNEPPASSSGTNGGSTRGSDGGSSAGGSSSDSGGASGTADRGTGQQGSQGKGADNGSVGGGKPIANGTESGSSQNDGGSSPLVPILIAILVLAAISLGTVMIRRRRQSGSAGSVSPEAS
jgi:hypothetical protein